MGEQELCSSLREALGRLLRGTGLEPGDVRSIDLDPYGPRIILVFEPAWARRVVLDASPDGVEAVVVLEAPRGLDPARAEELLLEAIEGAGAADALDEYDAAYDSNEGEALLELHTGRLTHLPNLAELARHAKEAIHVLGGPRSL